MAELRWATREDLEAYYGGSPAMSMQAIVVLEDGAPVAVAGLYYTGGYLLAFSDTKKCIDRRTIVKGLRIFRAMLATKPCRVLAVPENGLATAPSFLRHCGFSLLNGITYCYEG